MTQEEIKNISLFLAGVMVVANNTPESIEKALLNEFGTTPDVEVSLLARAAQEIEFLRNKSSVLTTKVETFEKCYEMATGIKSKDRYPDGLVSNYNVLHELKDKIQSFSLSEKGTGIPPLR